MSKAPFERFITTFLLFNKSIPFIVEKLKSFGYFITDSEVSSIFTVLKNTIPSSIWMITENNAFLDVLDPQNSQWLNQCGVLEFYDYIVRKDQKFDAGATPAYFNWVEDCLWVHKYKDVMCLINIFLFNDEPLENISKIVMFKYKKKIGIDALELYKSVFWDTNGMTAKEALYYCLPFRNNALIIRQLKSGESEIAMIRDDMNDGSDVSFVFHDSNYIKWKIGYNEFEVPDSTSFLKKVMSDSVFKYYEAMNMTQSVEVEESDGRNDKIGSFESTITIRKNVEDAKAKLAKHWLEVYMKVKDASGDGEKKEKGFFEKMNQLELDFGDEEKIASVESIPNLLNDIKGDINPIQ